MAIVGFGFFMTSILSIMVVMVIGKDTRESEKLAEAVEIAVYQSLQEGIDKQMDPGDLFYINLELLLTEDVYIVTIKESNTEKGILSVKVEMAYENMGKARTVEVERTVIYERSVAEMVS